MEEIKNLINNQVFQVDQMQNLQWKFSNETLTIGGLAIPPAMTHYSLSEENGIVFFDTTPKINPDPLSIQIVSKSPVVLVITNHLTKKILVTLRKS